MYREIMSGISLFLNTHINSYRMMWNDNLRPIFRRYLLLEVDTYDKWIKYGKIKGWIYVPPMFTA